MKRNLILVFVIILTSATAFAQRESLYSQFMFNRLLINPAYAGSRDALSTTLLSRLQWVGFKDAPRTMTFSVHTPLNNERVGLGFYAYADKSGPLTDAGFMGNYAYRIKINNGYLSFGLQAGFNQVNIDFSAISPKEKEDIVYQIKAPNSFQPDANFGIYYYTANFYAGVSAKQLFESQYNKVTSKQGNVVFGSLTRHFYGMTGAAFELNDNLVFRPSLMVKYSKNAPINYDINASFLINNVLWLGTSYRTNYNAITSLNALVFMIELNLSQRWRLGYSYDLYLSEVKRTNKGSHELMLSYDVSLFKPRLITPRYF